MTARLTDFAERWLVLTWMAAITGLIAWGVYLFSDTPWLRYPNLPAKPEHASVLAGKDISVTITRCNDSGEPRLYTVARNLVGPNGHVYVLADAVVMVEPGCTPATLQIGVPSDVSAGIYYVVGVSRVAGRVRDHEVGWASRPFEVTKGE